MLRRYDLLRIRTDPYTGQVFYEVADHLLGVIFWTKRPPS